MVKLVDTLASGASARKGVEVQVLSWAPSKSPFIYISVLYVNYNPVTPQLTPQYLGSRDMIWGGEVPTSTRHQGVDSAP